jgi:hypothetical protein
MEAEWGSDMDTLLARAPALREFYGRYYLVGPPAP